MPYAPAVVERTMKVQEVLMQAISGTLTWLQAEEILGCRLNYGPNLRDIYRGLARYVHRILRGAKPEDLPVKLPRTVELVVNVNTAKILGVKIPPSVLRRGGQLALGHRQMVRAVVAALHEQAREAEPADPGHRLRI